ncbi:WxL domain-containing protein [Levilactobacillus enshiensis]|uniref:WxL domain-containing protein n=1 Tax=Levilactobacillus enshiensis TaxID=2590213 RepID=UPI00117A8C42|nr:WxL domain-containing protein [Levilactobacillus enshiensis]
MGAKRWLHLGLVLVMAGLSWQGWCVGHADDLSTALATAPHGIVLDKTNPFVTTETTKKSSATVMASTNPNAPGTQVAALTSGPNQFGSMWATQQGLLDLGRDQTISMWLYLGNSDAQAGAGLAFVLQNDSRGLEATPGKRKGVIPGETLGVWGVDDDSHQSSAKKVAKTAIQNSWALEFDTQWNGQENDSAAGKANSFDVGYPVMHIASNYPGKTTTYQRHEIDHGIIHGLLGSRYTYYYNLWHKNVVNNVNEPNFLSNGQWHHLTIRYQKKGGLLMYTFDDRDPQMHTPQQGIGRTIELDLNQLDPQKTGQIRWGLTSATSDQFENHLVVLENVPGMVDVDSRTTLTDLDRKRVVTSGGQVKSKSRVRLDYHLAYRSGRQAWADIVAHLKVPKDIDVKEIKIAYSKGEEQQVSLTNFADNELSVRLQNALNEENRAAVISVMGQAKAVTTTKTVEALTSKFTSATQVSAADTPDFMINPHARMSLEVTSETPIVLSSRRDIVVEGTARLKGVDADDSSKIWIKAQLNGKALEPVLVNRAGDFQLPISGAQIQRGANHLELIAMTEEGDASAPVTVPITLVGTLRFSTVSLRSTFKETVLTGETKRVQRENDWILSVQDERGTGEPWTLTAQAEPFKTETGRPLVGQLIYVDTYRTRTIGAEATEILTRQTDGSEADTLYDVGNSWTPETGLLLSVGGGATAGKYQGTITWGLTNAPGYDVDDEA